MVVARRAPQPAKPRCTVAARISVPMPRLWKDRPSHEPVLTVATIPKSLAPMLVTPAGAPSTITARLSSHDSGDVVARHRHQYCSAWRSSSGDSRSVHGMENGISAGSCTPSTIATRASSTPSASST